MICVGWILVILTALFIIYTFASHSEFNKPSNKFSIAFAILICIDLFYFFLEVLKINK
jgi:hypothetical protein